MNSHWSGAEWAAWNGSMEWEDDDAMDGINGQWGVGRVDLPLENREVLVNHQTYTYPTDYNDDTWAEHERNELYIIWVNVAGKNHTLVQTVWQVG